MFVSNRATYEITARNSDMASPLAASRIDEDCGACVPQVEFTGMTTTALLEISPDKRGLTIWCGAEIEITP